MSRCQECGMPLREPGEFHTMSVCQSFRVALRLNDHLTVEQIADRIRLPMPSSGGGHTQ